MSGCFTYRLAKFLAMGVLAVSVSAVLMEELARLAIENDGVWTRHENAPGEPPQGVLPADVSATGRSATVGSGGVVVFSTEHGAAAIRGHDAAPVMARFIRGGRSLVTIDASGNARLSNVDAAWEIQRLLDGGSLGRVAGSFWKALGSPLAHRSLAALAHVRELSFRDCEDCPEMVVVPAGRFLMGSPENEKGRDQDEGPQHEVTLAAPFAISRYHVTRDQYARFVAATGYRAPGREGGNACYDATERRVPWESRQGLGWRFVGFDQTGDHPAVCISWDDARAFAAWLALKTGHAYRLLTEAEWEYAVRAGSRSAYSFGDFFERVCSYANIADATYKKIYGSKRTDGNFAKCDDGFAYTAPVGSFLPNGFGLFDMQGNVSTWVEDCLGDYKNAPKDGSARQEKDCKSHVHRGGSWIGPPETLRAAHRGFAGRYMRIGYIGFRLARTLVPTP